MSDSVQQTTCKRHPERAGNIICQRCDAPMCSACMTQASVGWHCPDCVAGHTRSNRAADKVVQTALHGHRPIATYTFIALCLLVFAWDLRHGTHLMSGAGSRARGELGLWAPAMEIGGEWYRSLSNGFAHRGVMHLGLNMLLLWKLGETIEGRFGTLTAAPMYVVGLLGGSLGALLVSPDASTIGASGVVFALIGATAAMQKLQGRSLMVDGIGALLVVLLLYSFRPGISLGGHLGGLVIGALMGTVIGLLRNKAPRHLDWFAPLALAVLGVVVAVAVVFATQRATGLIG